MRFKFLILAFFVLFSLFSNAASYQLPGDHLSQGQQYVASDMAIEDWYSGASFVGNAQREAIDDNARGFSGANYKGYGFSSRLTYLLGVTDDLTIGLQYGYEYDKNAIDVVDGVGDQIDGELVAEGGTDLTILAKFKRGRHSTWDAALILPVCSSEAMSDVCSSRPAVPRNSEQDGAIGGQGDGFYGVALGVSSNWISLTDLHWFGRAQVLGFISDEVYGQKVSAPLALHAELGLLMNIQPRHDWSLALQVGKKRPYSGFSEFLQTQVEYGEQSHIALKGAYHWQVGPRVQFKPFAQFAIRDLPTEQFAENGLLRRIEYTAGTQFMLGAQISANF